MKHAKARGLRPDEEELWEKVRQSTVPLHPQKRQALIEAVKEISGKQKTVPLRQFRIGQAANPTMPMVSLAPNISDQLSDRPLLMDHKSFGKMKRGKLVPQSRMDLHGMTLDQAHPALVGFVMGAYRDGLRLVLVITGKGRSKRDTGPIPVRKGILKNQVPHWLGVSPLSSVVLQVSEAHLKHGGSGAYYVYLRRQR